MQNFYYLSEQLAEKTNKKSIYDAYQRNNLTIVVFENGLWYFETCYPDRLYITVKKEMKRLYPELKYLYDAIKVRR